MDVDLNRLKQSLEVAPEHQEDENGLKEGEAYLQLVEPAGRAHDTRSGVEWLAGAGDVGGSGELRLIASAADAGVGRRVGLLTVDR